MSVLQLYEDLVAAKKLERDRAQERLLMQLVALEHRVAAHRSARRTRPVGWLFGGRNQDEPAKGIYVFG
ncbi:MAG: cell division protein ZapE, partial [Bradyrhizobium sp.]|nr:cell division protein ZapE [Bradyrhizobium sp.]